MDTFIQAFHVRVEEAVSAPLDDTHLRERGSQPILSDPEVLTLEIVGAYLGIEKETTLFATF